MSESCCTGNKSIIIYTCSGTADVGEISDKAVRKLWKEGYAQRNCLAGIGADISGFVQSAKGADVNITIDGCKTACAKKCLERIGVKPESYVLADFGLEKGKTPVTEETINKVCGIIKERRSAATGNSSACGCGCC
jgi:uncharacterized metal-binding protein